MADTGHALKQIPQTWHFSISRLTSPVFSSLENSFVGADGGAYYAFAAVTIVYFYADLSFLLFRLVLCHLPAP